MLDHVRFFVGLAPAQAQDFGEETLGQRVSPHDALGLLAAGLRQVDDLVLVHRPLAQARTVGADVTLHAQRDADALGKPQFDVAYEVSGNFNALKTCVAAVKRGGVIVQVGTLPHEPLPFVVNEIMAKELDLRGAFRWGIEFDWAVDYLSSRRVDVRPLLSGQYPLQEAVAAFHAAADKNRSTKVQVVAA